MGKEVVLLTHGFRKRDATVSAGEIDRALAMLAEYKSNPKAHTYE